MQLWFYFDHFTMPSVSPCKLQGLVRPQGLARPLGAQEFQDTLLLFLSKVLPDLLCLQAGKESEQYPGRSEADQRLLKPEQDFLHFNFPNNYNCFKMSWSANFNC